MTDSYRLFYESIVDICQQVVELIQKTENDLRATGRFTPVQLRQQFEPIIFKINSLVFYPNTLYRSTR